MVEVWTEDLAAEGVPAEMVMTLYNGAREDANPGFMPSLSHLLARWKPIKDYHKSQLQPTWHELTGLRTHEEEQARILNHQAQIQQHRAIADAKYKALDVPSPEQEGERHV